MKPLGTILPTADSLRKTDQWFIRDERKKEEIAKQHLSQFERKVEQLETRYYDGEDRYAIVGSRYQILWFEKRNNQWYSNKAKK